MFAPAKITILLKELYCNQKKVLVDIQGVTVERQVLECLLHDTSFLEGDVLSAYIQLIRAEKHLRNRAGGTVFLENTLNTSVLKRDGKMKLERLDPNVDYIEKRVCNYLEHDMVFLPINIKDFHWYLAVVDGKNQEIRVLDSLGKLKNRSDLVLTITGLQRHIDIVAQQKDIQTDWKDLQVQDWPMCEEFISATQTDGTSCGLFMINYMEYWTGKGLSDSVTQGDMKNFRFKLLAILLNCQLNTREWWLTSETVDKEGESTDEIEILDRPLKRSRDEKSYVLSTSNMSMCEEDLIISRVSNYINSISDTATLGAFAKKLDDLLQKTKARDLTICGLPMGEQELRDQVCNYIMTIDHDMALEKEWVVSSKPYPIVLSFKKIQDILKQDQGIHEDCFNLVARKFAFEELEKLKGTNKVVSKHYMDLKFSVACQLRKGDQYRTKVDYNQLAKLALEWPWRKYNVKECTWILMPLQTVSSVFILFVLHISSRTLYILDQTPKGDEFKIQPLKKYITKIQRVSTVLNKVMEVSCPWWKDDLILFDHRVADAGQFELKWELSGYNVLLAMRAWNSKRIETPICTDAYEVRKHILLHLFTYTGNQNEANIPEGVRDYLRRYISLTDNKQ